MKKVLELPDNLDEFDDENTVVREIQFVPKKKKNTHKNVSVKGPNNSHVIKSVKAGPKRVGHDASLNLDVFQGEAPTPPRDHKMLHKINDSYFYEDDSGKQEIVYKTVEEYFINDYHLATCNGLIYTPDGLMNPDVLEKMVCDLLRDTGYKKNIAKPVSDICKSIVRSSYAPDVRPTADRIPFANGDLELDKGTWRFYRDQKRHSLYRLSAEFHPDLKDAFDLQAEAPNFYKWLTDLFYDDDIPTIQQMLGYMLVPTTSVQEMFVILGKGGEGKSILCTILKAMIGKAALGINLEEFLADKFQIADLEGRLVAFDDDMGSAALKETGLLKKLITSKTALNVQRKYGHPYEICPFTRFVCCTNHPLQSLYDMSKGFYRRLHTIQVKPCNRAAIEDDPHMEHKIECELDAVTYWAVCGLRILRDNDWKIHTSEKSRDFQESQEDENSIVAFFNECLEVVEDAEVSSADLKAYYSQFCHDNVLHEYKWGKVQGWLKLNASNYGFKMSNHVGQIKGQSYGVRGFKNLKIREN